MRYYVETYGCWLAKADARILEQRYREEGHVPAASPEEADLLLVYTCAVREDGEVRQLRRIEELARHGKELVVAGCLARERPYTITRVGGKVRLVYPSAVEGGADRSMKVLPEYDPPRHGLIHVVPVQVGCLGNCTFCVTKFTRGGAGYVRSASPLDVVENVGRAVARGAREIYITGQDVATYGYDRRWEGGYDLPSLLELVLSRVEGEYRVRIGMSEPLVMAKFMDRLLDIVKRDGRVYRYFHIPVQSGSDRVLRLMNRKYTVDEFRSLVGRIRRELGDRVFIATDIIVGFPGEDEEDFEATVRLVRDLAFDKVHVARYSRRPYTEAAVYDNQVPDPVKKARSKVLSRVALETAHLRNVAALGRRDRVLVTEVDHGLLVGRASDYRQVVVARGEHPALGNFVDVRIVHAEPIYVYGDVLS